MSADLDVPASPIEQAILERLSIALVERAGHDGSIDLAYTVVDSPLGPLLLAATPTGLARVAFSVQDHEAVLAELAVRISPRVMRNPKALDDAARQLDEYFAGQRQKFELPLDLQLLGGYRRTVVEHLAEIGYGRTESYAEVAAATGNPKAVRAVGSACRVNPVPLVLPCHRVVRSDGSVGQYAGGPDAKRRLLSLEGATMAR